MPLRELRRLRGASIGLIPQNPNASLDPVMKIRRQLAEAITTHKRYTRREAEGQAADLLDRFGFQDPEDILDRYAFQMSGGMNQRLVSALGLACHPGWVIADEPTKGLDAVIRNQVYAVLRDIYIQHHSSMIVITHDLHLARRLCDELRVLYMGQIIEQDTAGEVMERPKHPYTEGLIRSLPSRDMEPIPPASPDRLDHTGCPFYPRCARASARCGREVPGDFDLPTGGDVIPLLELRDVCRDFSHGVFRPKTVHAVDHISFSLERGKTYGLVGNSGCGKTTLSRMITRLLRPTSGRIYFQGELA